MHSLARLFEIALIQLFSCQVGLIVVSVGTYRCPIPIEDEEDRIAY